MHIFSIHFALSADSPLGKVDKLSLSQQTLMELLVENVENTAFICGESDNVKDISEWENVSFNDAKEVTDIDWFNKSLRGNIPLKWLPSSLKMLILSVNALCGTVDLTCLPDTLEWLSLSNNKFEGTVDLRRLPQKLEVLHLSFNNFNGKTDFSHLPASLTHLDVTETQLSGEILDFNGTLLKYSTGVTSVQKDGDIW